MAKSLIIHRASPRLVASRCDSAVSAACISGRGLVTNEHDTLLRPARVAPSITSSGSGPKTSHVRSPRLLDEGSLNLKGAPARRAVDVLSITRVITNVMSSRCPRLPEWSLMWNGQSTARDAQSRAKVIEERDQVPPALGSLTTRRWLMANSRTALVGARAARVLEG